HTCSVPSDMRPVVLDRLSVQTLLAGLVIEDLGNNELGCDVLAVAVGGIRRTICCIALGETWGIEETCRIEKGVQLINPRVYDSDFDVSARSSSARRSSPGAGGIIDLVPLAKVGIIKKIVPDSLHHRRSCNRCQW